MATKCITLVRGRSARFTRVDSCGRPVYGEASTVTTEGFISIAYTANTDDGEEINVPNAAGKTCVYAPAVPKFLGYTAEVTFCNVDPDLFAMATGQRTITDAFGDVVGFTMDTAVSAADNFFALEVWAGAQTDGVCAAGAGIDYGYVLMPFFQAGIVGDFTIENAEVTFTLSAAATRDNNAWGVGPYNVVSDAAGDPSPLWEPVIPTEHMWTIITTVAPPEAECGARPLLPLDDAALTGVTATPTALSVLFAPTPVGTDPWWIDFGDGTWDYDAAGTSITHVYEAAGTYTFQAYRGASTFSGTVTTSV